MGIEGFTLEKTKKIQTYVLLHILLLVFSLGGICSKYAANSEFLSFRFFLFYGLVLLVSWQMLLIWGIVIFGEALPVQKVIGTLIIVAGVVLVVKADED